MQRHTEKDSRVAKTVLDRLRAHDGSRSARVSVKNGQQAKYVGLRVVDVRRNANRIIANAHVNVFSAERGQETRADTAARANTDQMAHAVSLRHCDGA